jgi:hypothetical protein
MANYFGNNDIESIITEKSPALNQRSKTPSVV